MQFKEASYMKLSQMFDHAPDIEIGGLCIDSRKVKKNDMYFCMEGMVHDGQEFRDEVSDKGAVCIVHTKPIENRR